MTSPPQLGELLGVEDVDANRFVTSLTRGFELGDLDLREDPGLPRAHTRAKLSGAARLALGLSGHR